MPSFLRFPGSPGKLTPWDECFEIRRAVENRHANSSQLAKSVESQTGASVSWKNGRGVIRQVSHYKSPCTKMFHLPRIILIKEKNTGIAYFSFWNWWHDPNWHHKEEEYNEKCMAPRLKHGGASALLCGCLSAAGVGKLHFRELPPSLWTLSHRALFQHDNDPKHTTKATVAWPRMNRLQVNQWLSMLSNLSLTDHLRGVEKTGPKSIFIQHPASYRAHGVR